MTGGSADKHTRRLGPTVAVAAVFVVFAVIAGGYGLYGWLGGGDFSFTTAAFEQLILSWGAWGVVASLALMVVHSFIPFPAEFIAFANGVVYGPLWGTVITWSGAMMGAALAFWLTRLLGERFVRRMVDDKRRRAIDSWVGREGAGILFVSRFVPVISFNLINIAAGLTRIKWWTFLWVSGLGILPMTTLMVVMGDRIEHQGGWIWIAFFIAAALLWLVFRLVWRRPRR